MTRHLCVHGHFYQPPRENPWTGRVERQPSAAPFHDWNERITAECYAPNAAARILDGDGRVRALLDNYSRISFDFGPTLLSWMETEEPELYRSLQRADRIARERYGGHGTALAQAHGHLILPLANRRDKVTEVRWGLADFEHRFGRKAEGLWLPETAVDVETLEVLAAEGVAFTILEPGQAARVRPIAQPGAAPEPWAEVAGGSALDPLRPYRCRLPSGREIALFFYHGPLSRAVAFDRLLDHGGGFARRLLSGFGEDGDGDPHHPLLHPFLHIATDGETYGHHHKFGEMALAWAWVLLEEHEGVRWTCYGEYLEHHPPTRQVEIVPGSSWSCAHGVERWRFDCGCSTGGEPGWTQAWRAPLRAALDGLRDRLAVLYEAAAGELVADPWAARDASIGLRLDPRPETVDAFFAEHRRPDRADPSPTERERMLALLEMQRHALSMYTSCGWFFHDLAGIETVQILRYAARALELARELTGDDPEPAFVSGLAAARSNDPAEGDGARIWRRRVLTAARGAARSDRRRARPNSLAR